MIVLDASAVVDVLLDRPPAEWVLQEMQNQELSAPSHQPAEVVSAVARVVRSGQLEPDTAQDVIAEFAELVQMLVLPTREHLHRAMQLQPRVRVLDGLYVALAASLACPLVTTDHRLARAGLPVEVRSPEPTS
jgi:predicted nucleic acid-binding protein